jgi:hypothetical protein
VDDIMRNGNHGNKDQEDKKGGQPPLPKGDSDTIAHQPDERSDQSQPALPASRQKKIGA